MILKQMTITEYAATLKVGDKIYIENIQGWGSAHISIVRIDTITRKGWIKSYRHTFRLDASGNFSNGGSINILLPDEGKILLEKQRERVFIQLKKAELLAWLESAKLTKEMIEKIIAIKESLS